MSEKMRVMLCCNNPDNGSDTGYVRGFDFGDQLTVHNYGGRGIVCRRVNDTTLRIGRINVPIIGYRTWVGNWCWDAALMTVESANRIAEYIRERKDFNPEMGEIEVWNAWDNGQPIKFRADNPVYKTQP